MSDGWKFLCSCKNKGPSYNIPFAFSSTDIQVFRINQHHSNLGSIQKFSCSHHIQAWTGYCWIMERVGFGCWTAIVAQARVPCYEMERIPVTISASTRFLGVLDYALAFMEPSDGPMGITAATASGRGVKGHADEYGLLVIGWCHHWLYCNSSTHTFWCIYSTRRGRRCAVLSSFTWKHLRETSLSLMQGWKV